MVPVQQRGSTARPGPPDREGRSRYRPGPLAPDSLRIITFCEGSRGRLICAHMREARLLGRPHPAWLANDRDSASGLAPVPRFGFNPYPLYNGELSARSGREA